MPSTSELSQHTRISGARRNVPTIGLQALADSETAATLRAACHEVGFFHLADFDGDGTISRTIAQMEAFFGLDDDDARKQAVRVPPGGSERGWTPMFEELPYQAGTVAHMESFDCGRPDACGRGENRWPDLPGFRDDVRACWDLLARVGVAALDGLSLAAGLDRRFLADRCASHELSTLRLLHYPPHEAPAADADVGISAHTDFECMTLIMQTAPGLELLAADGSWYDVPNHDGRLLVMLDDMLERFTNGYFRATGHRVRVTPGRRYSIVMFFAVDDDVDVAPLSQFVSSEQPAAFGPVRQRDHLNQELARAAQNRGTT